MRLVTAIPLENALGAYTVRDVCNVLARAWAIELRSRPLPALYSSGVRYQREPNAGEYEHFKTPYETFEDGWGDCDDLAIYRCAELICSGESATVQSMRVRGTTRYHVRIRRADGREEDPSILVGKFRTT